MDDMRGKLGRIVISKNKYGSIAYEMPEYVDRKSNAQIKTRQLHSEVIELWHTLTPKEIYYIDRQASDVGIRSLCKPAKIVDGYSLFYYLKRNLQEIGEPLTKEVKGLTLGVQHIYDIRVELKKFRGKQGLRLFIGDKIDENTKLIVYATHSLGGGIGKPNESWYRKISVLDSKFKSGSYITTDYLKVFKSIEMDKISIYFRFKTVDKISGLASNPEISIFTLLL